MKKDIKALLDELQEIQRNMIGKGWHIDVKLADNGLDVSAANFNEDNTINKHMLHGVEDEYDIMRLKDFIRYENQLA